MRGFRRGLGIGFIALVLFLAATGWLSPQKTWQEMTGWEDVEHKPLPLDAEPQITWLGHSGFLIKWEGVNLLLDPILSPSCPPVKRLFDGTDVQWPDHIDAALISHGHYDHFDLDTLEAAPGLKNIVAPEGLDSYLTKTLKARSQFQPMREGRVFEIGKLKATAVKAIHSGARSHPFGSSSPALGYVISNGSTSIYFAGDTAYGKHFRQIAKEFKPQIAILPIGAFEPRFVLRDHHLNPADAVKAARDLNVETVIPCHFGTYRLAFDLPQTALPLFADLADQAGIRWAMPLPPGYNPEQIARRQP